MTVDSLRRILPASIRIHGIRSVATALPNFYVVVAAQHIKSRDREEVLTLRCFGRVVDWSPILVSQRLCIIEVIVILVECLVQEIEQLLLSCTDAGQQQTCQINSRRYKAESVLPDNSAWLHPITVLSHHLSAS